MSTVTATVIAWVPPYQMTRFSRALQDGDQAEVCEAIALSNNERMGLGKDAWTRVGTAQISVELVGEDKIVSSAVQALRNQQQAVRAEAERHAVEIERQIQKLLSITNQVTA